MRQKKKKTTTKLAHIKNLIQQDQPIQSISHSFTQLIHIQLTTKNLHQPISIFSFFPHIELNSN
jgi:hypothetical protein